MRNLATICDAAIALSADEQDFLGQLFSRHQGRLFRFAVARLGDPHTAEDVVQDTFLAAHRALRLFEQRSAVGTYLVGILKNKISDYQRAAMKERMKSSELHAVISGRSAAPHHDGAVLSNQPDERLRQRTVLESVQTKLATLPPAPQIAFRQWTAGISGRTAICRNLEISSNNFGVRLHRAKADIRAYLCEQGLAD